MSETKFTPGPWKAEDKVGAGWEIDAVLPEGFQFDATCHGASGKPWFQVWVLHESKSISFCSERWVQFETQQWKEMQAANAHLIAAAPELYAACNDAMIELSYLIDQVEARHDSSPCEALVKCREALRKARGDA